jgi:hypothetical protein
MSLEDAISKLNASVEALTAAMKGFSAVAPAPKASAPAAAPTPAPTPAPAAAKEYVGQHTKDEMKAMVTKVKEKHGVPAAKAIIKTDGGADKLDDINDPKIIDKVYEVAKAKYEEDGI